MKKLARLLTFIAALTFGIQPALAGFVINSFQIASVPATISFVGCTVDATDLTTYTFTNHATGTAGTRKTIVGVGGSDGATDFSISSMTVGGASATEIVDTANAGSLVQSAIYIINNPSGTTATVGVTFSEAISQAVVCVWAAYDINSETATATATGFQTAGAANTLSLNVSTDGIAVGMSNTDAAAITHVWTGMTERADATVESGATGSSYSSADSATAGTPLAVTVDSSSTTDNIGATSSFR